VNLKYICIGVDNSALNKSAVEVTWSPIKTFFVDHDQANTNVFLITSGNYDHTYFHDNQKVIYYFAMA